MYDLTTHFSNTRDIMGVSEMGLKSPGCKGWLTFGIGVITAAFHCRGTTPETMDRLNRYAIGAANYTDAPNLRNHAGMLSRPAAVGCSLFRRWNTLASDTNSHWSGAVNFRAGWRYSLSTDIDA